MVSDGDNNNMIMLAITKVKTTDEGEYRVVVENCHGSDEKSFMLYVSGQSGLSSEILNISSPSLIQPSIRVLNYGFLQIDEAFYHFIKYHVKIKEAKHLSNISPQTPEVWTSGPC